jgi:hypothetical protein
LGAGECGQNGAFGQRVVSFRPVPGIAQDGDFERRCRQLPAPSRLGVPAFS